MQENDPKVSVTMITYNHEPYIERAIEGVLMQNVDFPYELIIADDRSPDDTRAIALRYKELYPDKIKLLFQPENVGMLENARMARELCRGEYKAFCEGDDYWNDPFKLQKQVDFLDTHPEYVGVVHQMQVVDQTGHLKRGFWTNMYCDEEVFDLSQVQRMVMPGQTATRVFRNIFKDMDSELLEKYDDMPVPADRKLSLLLALNGDVYCMPEVMSSYRWVTSGGTSFNANAGKKIKFDTFVERANHLSDFAKEEYGVELDYSNYLKVGMMEVFLRAIRHPRPINIKTFVRAMNNVRIKPQVTAYMLRRFVPFTAKRLKQAASKFSASLMPSISHRFVQKADDREWKYLTFESDLLQMETLSILACTEKATLFLSKGGIDSTPDFLSNEEALEYELTRLRMCFSEAPYYCDAFPALEQAMRAAADANTAHGDPVALTVVRMLFAAYGLSVAELEKAPDEVLSWSIERVLDEEKVVGTAKSSLIARAPVLEEIQAEYEKKHLSAGEQEAGERVKTVMDDAAAVEEQRVFAIELAKHYSRTLPTGWDGIVEALMNHSKGSFATMLNETAIVPLDKIVAKNVVVVIGASRGQIPLIEKCKARGLEVAVVSVDGDYPGFDLADYKVVADIRDRDAVLKALEDFNVLAVMTDQLDISVPTVAYVAEKRGVPSIGSTAARWFTSKFAMKRVAESIGVKVAPYAVVEKLGTAHEVAQKFGYPVVIKPLDSDSSRGVFKIASPQDLDKHFSDSKGYSSNGDVLVEKFISGAEYCVEGLKYNLSYYNLCIGRRSYFDLDDVFIPKATDFVDALSARDDVERRVLTLNQRVATAMNLPFGLTHAEFLYSIDSDEIFLVEIAARGGGCGISSDLVPRSCGVDVLDVLIDESLGNPIDPERLVIRRGASAYHCFSLPEGRVASIAGVEESAEIAGVNRIALDNVHVGDEIEPMVDKSSRKGPILVYGKTSMECDEAFEHVKSVLDIQVETPDGLKGIQW